MNNNNSAPMQAEATTSGGQLPASILQERLSYDHETGRLRWLDAPLGYFPTEQARRLFMRDFAGKPAFTTKSPTGYLHGSIRWEGKRFFLLAHRVCWAVFFGEWPKEEIDHINRDRADNRIVNLREASRSKNAFNRQFQANKTGYAGVQKQRNRFSAKIRINNKKAHLGTFASAEEAHEAYIDAARKMHGEHADWLAK